MRLTLEREVSEGAIDEAMAIAQETSPMAGLEQVESDGEREEASVGERPNDDAEREREKAERAREDREMEEARSRVDR